MNSRIYFVLVALAFAAGASADEPTAASLKQCPNGHTTLKDVPIVYADQPAWKGLKGEALDAAKNHLEFVPSDERYAPGCRTNAVICAACRFTHCVDETSEHRSIGWYRAAWDLNGFNHPFSGLVTTFPVPSQSRLKNPVAYWQMVGEDFSLQTEGFRFTTTESHDQLRQAIDKWISAREIKYQFTERTNVFVRTGRRLDMLEWEGPNPNFYIYLDRSLADKSCEVTATFFKEPRKQVALPIDITGH